jgi:pyruvate dehydrogenase E1 component beta subunit
MEAPISESAFLGAGVGAALGGLRPVVEIMFVDFLSVALHQLANEAAMIGTFSGGRWPVPLLIRAACGGGYGDAGQHEQALWGQLAAIPGVVVAVPSTAADAAGLTLALLRHQGPSVLLEHKLLSELWRQELGGAHRPGVDLDVPTEAEPIGAIEEVPLGRAALRRRGTDIAILSLAVGVHRALEAATRLAGEGVEATVLDLRTVTPLDVEAIAEAAGGAGAVLVVDEDYAGFGLSGEVAAVLAERSIHLPFARVATSGVIPYARRLERQALPSVDRILDAARVLTGNC